MNKSMKQAAPVARRVELTEEQKLAQRAQIYLQKKESYALNAAMKMLEKAGVPSEKDIDKIVARADYFSDKLLETLFDKPQEDEKSEDNANEED